MLLLFIFRESLKENMKASVGTSSMGIFRHNLEAVRKAVFVVQVVMEDTRRRPLIAHIGVNHIAHLSVLPPNKGSFPSARCP